MARPRCRVADGRSAKLPAAVKTVVDAIEDRKGVSVRVLDLHHLSNAADYFIIASGTSDAHVRGLADGVMRSMLDHGHRTHGIEGLQTGRWVLLDFVDVVVHLFHPESRAFYQLERLWQDAPVLLSGP